MRTTNYRVQEIAPGSYAILEFGLDIMYLIVGTKRALVIDTGTGAGNFKGFIESKTALPYDVTATHGHGDHVGGAGQFESIYIHDADLPMLDEVTVEFRKGYCEAILQQYPEFKGDIDLDGIAAYPKPKTLPLKGGDSFDLGDRVITAYEAPGHTPGSVVFVDSKTKLVYSGDAYNPIFLLVMPGEDRMAVVRMFHAHAKAFLELKQREGLGPLYSGHDAPLPEAVLPDLVACCEGILDGSIRPEPTEIHIFEGQFCNYGLAHIVYDGAMFSLRKEFFKFS
ncbi:MAG: MBL fold metallo-hydrolase [Christensenellaceae bacterium]|jgi:glyoxylase-like metal-dependent hydrolase (beta-lactamase superfamily II)|nr:MBL fold metallo-hydrolase [Christensenellaceae bacterium]